MIKEYPVGKGWWDLIEVLEHELKDLTGEEPKPTQIKEKFGGLRYYYTTTSEGQKLISFAERLSYTICEECGNKGRLREFGWMKTLCKDCWLKDLERFNEDTKKDILRHHKIFFKEAYKDEDE